MIRINRWLTTLGLLAALLAGGYSPAAAELEEKRLPAALDDEFDDLREVLDPSGPDDFTPEQIENILQFLRSPREENTLYHGGKWRGAPSAFFRFDLATDLERLLQYGFNPGIPPSALLPSSVRVADWTRVNGQEQPLPRLWEELPELNRPIVVRGVEFNENTPDVSTGAYHAYHLERALVLFRYQGSPVFLSLSRQQGKSSVGKKGAILGQDSQWDYLYSDEPGLTIGGLGWASSYLYESFSAVIFYQPDPDQPLLRGAIIKWLRAGWLGFNMVNSGHIHSGLIRFVEGLRSILEDPQLPPPQQLIEGYRDIRQLPEPVLRERVKSYVARVKKEHSGDPALDREPFSRLIQGDNYANVMTRRELQGVLDLELMKCALGRKCAEEILSSAPAPRAAARRTPAKGESP